jgi:hypothetical protein
MPRVESSPAQFNPVEKSKEVQPVLTTPFRKDAFYPEPALTRVQDEARRSVSIAAPRKKTSQELIIEVAFCTENLQRTLLESTLDHQKEIANETDHNQKEINKLLSERRKQMLAQQNVEYAANFATGTLSVLSLGVGATLSASPIPGASIPGSFMMASGALSLSSMALDYFGFDPTLTRSLSGIGVVVGIAATATAGYLNPQLFSVQPLQALLTLKSVVSGLTMIATANQDAKAKMNEADLTQEQKDQDHIKHKMTRVFEDLKEIGNLISNTKEVSEMLKKQQDLMYQYLSTPMQG